MKDCNVAHISKLIVTRVCDYIYTVFLFTKSDIKTTLIPTTIFATAVAPIDAINRLPHILFWIWLHLLQFDVSNQTMSPEEDLLNKMDRPLPSKRLTLREAILLRWILIPLCWALSLAYSFEIFYSSVVIVFLTILYNELSAHAAHWFIRNLLNACGLASFEAGATLLAGSDVHHLHDVATLSILVSAGILTTTIQAQDFKDEPGDRSIGRQTIPIMFPSIARYTVVVPLILWSGGLSVLWQLDPITGCIFMCLALLVCRHFLIARTIASDQIAYYWYNAWVTMAHALPAYYHLYAKGHLSSKSTGLSGTT